MPGSARRGPAIAICVLIAASGVARAQPITVRGTVKRADNKAPIAGATVRLKTAVRSPTALATTTAGADGSYQLTADVDDGFVCEATARGLTAQVFSRPANKPTCDFELSSKLAIIEVSAISRTLTQGPGLTMIIETSALLLSRLTVRLVLDKFETCGSPGKTHVFRVAETIDVDFGTAAGLVTTGDQTFRATGIAPIDRCQPSNLVLSIEPASELTGGTATITVILPERFTLKRGFAGDLLDRIRLAPRRRTTTIDHVEVELESGGAKAWQSSARGLGIPVTVTGL